jgi:hypothetical protein
MKITYKIDNIERVAKIPFDKIRDFRQFLITEQATDIVETPDNLTEEMLLKVFNASQTT